MIKQTDLSYNYDVHVKNYFVIKLTQVKVKKKKLN